MATLQVKYKKTPITKQFTERIQERENMTGMKKMERRNVNVGGVFYRSYWLACCGVLG